MLSGVVQPVNERSRLPLQPYHSVWLAHWKRTDCDAAGETVSLNVLGSQELDCMSKKDSSTMGLEASTRSAHRLGKIKNRTFELGDDFINAGGKSVGKERKFSSIVKDGQDADDVQVLIPELAQNLKLNSTVHNNIIIPWSGCHSLEDDNSDDPPKLTRTCSARKDSFFRLNPLPERFDVEVDKFDKGKSAVSPATDKMSMDSFMDNTSKKNLHSASNSTASAKTFNMVSTEVVPSREVGYPRRNSKLHGVNLKPGAATWSEKMCPRSSTSQSLQNKKLVEQPKVKFIDEFPNPDSGNRWVKRLKLSSLNSSIQGMMKSSNFSSTAYDERRNKLFNGVPKSNAISSEPNIETADDKGIALLLSHGWIRRWRRIKTSEEALCEPESPKMEVEKFNEMQTPSIAAMAMMAKALTCSQQCELQKKGSYAVWNTKTP